MILNCDLDGQAFALDLSAVTGWDCLSFDLSTGLNLEQTVMAMLSKAAQGAEWSGAEKAIALWLYQRQAVNPNVTLQGVASGLQVFPDVDESPGDDAEDSADRAQGDDGSDHEGVLPDLV